MKKIIRTDGIVLINVCDEYMLVATKTARGKVPYLQHINEAAAFYWHMLEEGQDMREIAKAACLKYHMTPQKAVQALRMFIYQLRERGYIKICDIEEEQ